MVGGPGGLVCEPDHTPATRFKRYRVRGSRRLGSATWVASVKCLGKSSVQSGSEGATDGGYCRQPREGNHARQYAGHGRTRKSPRAKNGGPTCSRTLVLADPRARTDRDAQED